MDTSQKKKYKWEIHEDMLNILNYKRNANENHIEILSHPSQNGYHQEHKPKMLIKMQS
jgi:hypothetical protein